MSGMRIVILGLSITSSWGNGHATTYRGLVEALVKRGHDVLFLERDVPWYAANRDLPNPPYGRTELYTDLPDLLRRFREPVQRADLVMVGSYVPDGIAVGEWVISTTAGLTAFYDIDTPVTLASLDARKCDYLSTDLIPRYHMILSFTGGKILRALEAGYGARRAYPLYCSVNPSTYFPEPSTSRWDLGYMGTYSADRQPSLERLLLAAAAQWKEGRFIVVGPQYPERSFWGANVTYVPHLPPAQHRTFYSTQRFTLNITRREMIRWGWSPSIRLFEAAACATPILTDYWEGLEDFFTPGEEILVTRSTADTLDALLYLPDPERTRLGERARERVMAYHTAEHRAAELESYVQSLIKA